MRGKAQGGKERGMTMTDDQIKKTWELHEQAKLQQTAKEKHIDELAHERTAAILTVAASNKEIATAIREVAAVVRDYLIFKVQQELKQNEKEV